MSPRNSSNKFFKSATNSMSKSTIRRPPPPPRERIIHPPPFGGGRSRKPTSFEDAVAFLSQTSRIPFNMRGGIPGGAKDLIVEEKSLMGIPYISSRTSGSSILYPRLGTGGYTGSGPTRGSSAMKRMSKADEERWSPGRSGKRSRSKDGYVQLTELGRVAPWYKDQDPVVEDRLSPRDEWGRKQSYDTQDWANSAGLMEYLNNIYGGGRAFEQDEKSLANRDNVRRTLLLDNGIREISYPEYGNKKLPQGLVQGRTFYGLPGGRSPRGVGTAKRLAKTSIYDPPKPPKKRKPPFDDRFPPIPRPFPPDERKFPRITPRYSPEELKEMRLRFQPYTRSGPTAGSQQYK